MYATWLYTKHIALANPSGDDAWDRWKACWILANTLLDGEFRGALVWIGLGWEEDGEGWEEDSCWSRDGGEGA